MNRHKLNDVAELASTGGGHHFVHGKIDRMKHIAERFIRHGREKPVVAVSCPFKAGPGTIARHFRGIQQRQLATPRHAIARGRKRLSVGQGRVCYPFLAIMENANVIGDARRVPVQRRGAGNIAFGIAVGRDKAQNFGLNIRERHGRPAQFVLRAAGPLGRPRCATRAQPPTRPPRTASRASADSTARAYGTEQRPVDRGWQNRQAVPGPWTSENNKKQIRRRPISVTLPSQVASGLAPRSPDSASFPAAGPLGAKRSRKYIALD